MKRLFNLRHGISFRLYMAIGFAVSLTFAASLVGWFSLDRVGIAQSRVNDESVPEIAAAFAVAQYAGDLVTATDRLSVAATTQDLASIREYIGGISPALSEQVAFLGDSSVAAESDAERLMRIRANSDSLVSGVSEFEDKLLEYFELAGEGAALRRRLADTQSNWRRIEISTLDDEVAFSAEELPEGDTGNLPLLVQLHEDVGVVELSLARAAVAVDAGEIEQFRQSYLESASRAEQGLADLSHLPSHSNLSRVIGGFSSLGSEDRSAFDVWAQELLLAEQRLQLLGANYQIALLLIADVEVLVREAQARVQAATDASAEAIGLGRVLLLTISMVSLVGASLVAWLLVSSLIRRLGYMSVRMRRMAGGDLEEPVEAIGQDEVAEMAAALEGFRHNALEAIRLNLVEELATYLQERNEDLAEALANLRKAQDRLIAQEKLSALGELVAGLAHEINNPLNFVNNFSGASADLLTEVREVLSESKNGQLTNEQRGLVEEIIGDLVDNMERIGANGSRASNIVQAMLTMGRETVARQPSNINRLLDEHVQVSYQNARSADEDFQLDLQFDCEEMDQIEVNPRDIGRVVLNMVNNACYATDEKRRSLAEVGADYVPTLWISTRRVDGQVEIRLRDNGTGIPPDVIDRIFNPFFTTKPTDRGTGLGLTICNDVVREHGGAIEVTSEPGEFTEMLLTLPVEPLAAPDVDIEESP